MEFYEEYIPLGNIYPFTFAPRTRSLNNHTMSDVRVTVGDDDPEPSPAEQWDTLLDSHDVFMAPSSGQSSQRKYRAVINVSKAYASLGSLDSHGSHLTKSSFTETFLDGGGYGSRQGPRSVP
jgi:hypothetical protein